MLKNSLLFLNCLVCSFVISQCQTIETIPETTDAQPVAYVAADKGETNVFLQCFTFSALDSQLVTDWDIQRSSIETNIVALLFHTNNGSVLSPPDLADDLIVTGELVPNSSITFRTNFTFLNFTEQFDTTTLQCGTGSISRTFILGFPVAPSIRDDLGVQSVVEDDGTIMVNMTSLSSSNPFPPQLSFQWMFNGQNITNTSMITINDYLITFTDVSRNASGTYTLTVSNTVTTTTASFELDVQFPAEAVPVFSDPLIVLNGTGSVTLVAFSSVIDGNPFPDVTWTGPDGSSITTNDKYNISGIPGQLIITNIIASDNGTYTSTVSNGIGPSLTQSVDLIIAVPAGPPMDLMVMNITDTSATLQWSPPNDPGIPPLSYYRVIATPTPPSDVNLTTYSTALLLYGIIPNTGYNVTVVGVATGRDQFDILMGRQSNQLSFQTLAGAPQFSNVTATPTNGSIDVKWSFRHTGGLSIDLDIYCQINSEGESRISDMLSCESNGCVNENMMGVALLGPVLAGEEYSCRIFANNSEGSDERNISKVIPLEGLPSIPIVSHSVFPGRIVLSVRVVYPGASSGLVFVVDLHYTSNGSLFRSITIDPPNYMSNQIIMKDIAINEGGMFSVTVRVRNSFGNSEDEVMIPDLTIVPVTSTTTQSPPLSTGPSTSTTTSTTSTGSITGSVTVTPTSTPTDTPTIISPGANSTGLSGGAIAGIVIAVIILLAIVALIVFIVVYLLYQSKGDSYKVEGGKGGVVVEEHDIDIGTELQSTKPVPDGSSPEKVPLANNPPRQELHYADLADFAPSKKPGQQPTPTTTSTAKPMPIEEVQYAVIRPQDQKKPEDVGATADDNL